MIGKWCFVVIMIIFTGAGLAIEQQEIAKSVSLETLDLSKMQTDWGSPQVNRSVGKLPLSIGGRNFESGIGTHADSVFLIELDGRALLFSAWVGVDDEVSEPQQSRGSVEFKVLGDNEILWSSGVVRGGQVAQECRVAIEGVKVLSLRVESVNNNNYDHADWAMAKIEYAGETPVALEIPRPEPYILTPKPGPKPNITGPRVFGVRPSNPFLFTVTATGDRPMTFEMKGLPKGLSLDPITGRITGTVEKEGTYETMVIAKNAAGKDKRSFKIVVGKKICLTPPMGWNSWNCWACAVDDEKVRATAKAIVDSGLINHGWSYINIDDCWMRKPGSDSPVIGEPVRDKEGRILCNAKFPDMEALTDYIHELGLKAGIYIGPGPTTCQNYEASWQHELQDAQQFAEWGFDYLKYDWCGYSDVSGNEKLDDLKRPYILMRQMLDQVDRDIVYSLCQYGWGDVWEWGAEVGGDCWRTTGDIVDTWSSMSRIGFRQADLYPYVSPGHWNDPDMLVVGQVGWGPNLHETRLTPDEQYTHISLWCLLSAPLLIGCPIEQIDDFTMSLLTNDEVLEINQDPLGQQARRVKDQNSKQIWTKRLEDGDVAVGLFNTKTVPQTVSVTWQEIGRPNKQKVRDLWRQRDEGVFKEFYSAEIPAHGVKLIRVQ